jgi:hypothetical protein
MTPHFKISMVKSAIRIIGGFTSLCIVSLANIDPLLAWAIKALALSIAISEIVGIVEEFKA